ncbi:MAG: SpoIIE family protein phosphatase, partial [Treponema sp.]|nr:SpoIIE family protein phosphatase [Treponema sp.]
EKDDVYSPVIIVHNEIYRGTVTIKDLIESIIAVEVRGRTLEISRKNRLLEQQQKLIKRDLIMAEHVQKSFYPSVVPKLDKWEIAFEFRPLESVSGDLYDFYYDKKNLNGISLFDVSGHGVASALVGILAKSVIQSAFGKNMDKPLSKIMSLVNKEIIEEKGAVENYMTGVILRMNDNEVEYVNAGHTDVLIKNKETYIFSDKQNTFRSRFIGIPDLPVEFNSITTKVPKDTYFLIYSDCLIESRNLAGDEMGTELLRKVFASSSSSSASAVLHDIMESFDAFTEAVPLKDDLTVIVLKYKG